MNEKEFLKAINSESNIRGRYTYKTVCELLSTELTTNRINFIGRLFNYFKKVPKSAEEIIDNNFELIFEKVNDDDIILLIKLLLANKTTAEIIKANLRIVLQRIINSSMDDKDEIYKLLHKHYLLEENLEYILQSNIQMEDFFSISDLLKGKNEEIDKNIELFMIKNKEKIAKYFLMKKIYYNKEAFFENYATTLSIRIDELLESEKCKYTDIKEIGYGTYSNTYQIGTKVLKIGENRQVYDIPNHRRLIQPLIRTQLIDKDNGLSVGCIEVEDRVRKLKMRERDKEKLYAIYKELRDSGIIWTDVKFANVGVLLQDNKPSLNGQRINVTPILVGFDRALDEEEILKEGEWVIIDLDCIYLESDNHDIEYEIDGLGLEFDIRYKNEKEGNVGKTITDIEFDEERDK